LVSASGHWATLASLPRHWDRSKALGLSRVREPTHGPSGGVADSLTFAAATVRPRAWTASRQTIGL